MCECRIKARDDVQLNSRENRLQKSTSSGSTGWKAAQAMEMSVFGEENKLPRSEMCCRNEVGSVLWLLCGPGQVRDFSITCSFRQNFIPAPHCRTLRVTLT